MSISEMQAEFSRVQAELLSHQMHDVRGKVARLEDAALAAVYAENERGAEARQVVADVARALGVDIDKGPGHRWDLDHMRRVVVAAEQLRADRLGWHSELTKLDEERAESRRTASDLSRRLRAAIDQRNVWEESTTRLSAERATLRDTLRRENERADAAIAREETAEQEAMELRRELREEREKNAALVAEKSAARAAEGRRGAVTWHSVGAEGRVSIAPGTTYVDELHDVIVSQAREIARLKGESE
ncbi:hypothetical protein [Streptomyces sp. NPDC091259]|uniref:hypothetical protein n=1 Tax=Streptomyces sp. NPDC091259 TaxID=3365976 RepID=UPI00382BD207